MCIRDRVDPIPEPDTDKTIEVFFTLKTDSEVWVPQHSVTVKEGSTVYHAFVKAMDAQSDMSYVGAEDGYVRSVTKAGVTLSEFEMCIRDRHRHRQCRSPAKRRSDGRRPLCRAVGPAGAAAGQRGTVRGAG